MDGLLIRLAFPKKNSVDRTGDSWYNKKSTFERGETFETEEQMRIAAYNYRDFDEARFFEKFSRQYQAEIIPIREAPTVENAVLAGNCEGVSVITTPITADFMKIW